MRVVPRVGIVSASKLRARFDRDRRLHRPSEFAAVLSGRKVLRGTSFDLHILDGGTQPQARLGLIVPKRLARAASLRNAIKRQGREAFRLSMAGLAVGDVVLRLKRPVDADKPEFVQNLKGWRREIEVLLDRLARRIP